MNEICHAARRPSSVSRGRRLSAVLLIAGSVAGLHAVALGQDEPPAEPTLPAAQAEADSVVPAEVDSAAQVKATAPADPLAESRGYLATAEANGAKRHLPGAYRRLEEMIDRAETGGADPATLAALQTAGRRLVNQSVYLAEIRERQSPLEALLGRYDQSLREIAALMGTAVDPELSGTPAADDLYVKLRAVRGRNQVRIDSLTVANRQLLGTVGADAAGRDSILVAMQVTISDLRHQLWETQLRVGIAEADRSAIAAELSDRRQFLEVVAQLETDLGPDLGEVAMNSGDVIVVRIFGFDFPSGSAELPADRLGLIDALARAVTDYGRASVTIGGHTDNTGSREANLRLSRRRAEAVAAALNTHLPAEAGSVVAVGHGPDLPIATNDTAAGRARNRRIEVTIAPAE
jgi:outer membrane protein OmpA-like peptidoglycan-associated protein